MESITIRENWPRPMRNQGMLDVAIRLAVEHHAGQVDKGGAPYILHPLRVMDAVRRLGELAMAIAVLHDVVEDTVVTFADLGALGFPLPLIVGVDLLTRPRAGTPGRPTHRAYVQRIADSRNALAIAVKIADTHDNLRRIGDLPASEQGLARRYEEALRILTGGDP